MAGTIVYTNPGGEDCHKAFASGTITSDGAATNVIVGFVPSKIVIFNTTDASLFIWTKGMAAGKFYQQLTAGTTTYEASGGPTVYGDTTDDTWATGAKPVFESTSGTGWTLPATAAMNTTSDVLVWEAWR